VAAIELDPLDAVERRELAEESCAMRGEQVVELPADLERAALLWIDARELGRKPDQLRAAGIAALLDAVGPHEQLGVVTARARRTHQLDRIHRSSIQAPMRVHVPVMMMRVTVRVRARARETISPPPPRVVPPARTRATRADETFV